MENKKLRVFVSTPMRGLTNEQIEAYRQKQVKIAEIMLGEEIEVIDSRVSAEPPAAACERVWFLGESIKRLAGANVLVTPAHAVTRAFNGCWNERMVAEHYGIRVIEMPYLPEDNVLMREADERRNREVNTTMSLF